MQLISRFTPYLVVIIVTALLLCLPFVAMQFTDEVNWSLGDFVLMALLLLGFGSLSVYCWQRLPRHRGWSIAAIVIAFFYCWIELAVGLLFNFGQ